MLEINTMNISSTKIKELVEITQSFLDFADTLLLKGKLSKDEHINMTLNKRNFIKDMKIKE